MSSQTSPTPHTPAATPLPTVQKLTAFAHLNLFLATPPPSLGERPPWIFASRKPAPLQGLPTADAVVLVVLVQPAAHTAHAAPSVNTTSIDASPTHTTSTPPASPPPAEPRLLIIEEYRTPLGAVQLGLPAGLVDPGEDLLTAAARELREETGLALTHISHVSPPLASSAGLTDETFCLVYGQAEGELSSAYLDAHERITARLLTFADLQALVAHPPAGFVWCGRLYAVALGLLARGTFNPSATL